VPRPNSKKAKAIDLFCGLGGWTEGLLAEGWDVLGFDIERHEYGEHRYPARLAVYDVCDLHGSWLEDADLIVASPPCQAYSYMAMPWTRAKAKAAAIRGDTTGVMLADLNRLFDACFRIQREASAAAGRHIPMVVENVRGAQPWVGKAQGNFGSFYLWGDVPELPKAVKASKVPGFRFDGNGGSFQTAAVDGVKVGGLDWKHPDDPRHRPGQAFNPAAQGKALQEARAIKNTGGSWFNVAHNTTSGKGRNPDGRKLRDQDGYERSHPNAFGWKSPRTSSRDFKKRKFASAMIAKIPLPLSRFIAAHFRP
jgi:hypothetical protein